MLFSVIRAATAITLVLLLPCAAWAITIGEIESQSKLGELLYIQVELRGSTNENVSNSCLSLIPPDPEDEDRQYYLTLPKLSLTTVAGRQYVTISSHESFNEAFAKLRLRVSCPGMGSVTKTFTFLPDLAIMPRTVAQTPINTAAPNVPLDNSVASANNVAPDNKIALAISPALINQIQPHATAKRRTQPVVTTQQSIGNHPRPIARKRSAPLSARQKSTHLKAFRLKLSNEPMDESRIGKITPEERELLLARQKMLDADDQMASFLTLQNQVKLLQDELGEIKLKLAQLATSTPPATVSIANIKESSLPWTDIKKNRIIFAVGVALAILALLFGFRLYNRINAQRLNEQAWKQLAEEAVSAPPVQTPAPASIRPSKTTARLPAKTPMTASPRAITPTKKTSAPPPSPPPPSSYTKSKEELAEVDSIIEEAELYATYGHPERAALILQELVPQYPDKNEAWLLLLSILSSLKKGGEFEQTARDFMRHNPNSPVWTDIQALGRAVEQNNPLYTDGNIADTTPPATPIASGKRRLIGDILVEAGVLSMRDMEKCLDDFDPKQHGRLGGYLVARKMVTPAQLQQALQQQQSIASPDTPSTPQDMENFLSDLNPQPDVRLDEYKKLDNSRSNKPKKT
ncbi:MAG: hypothetical protein Q7S51_09940 [Gallionellaceae bacterium]|nr:hypothetical protein [Gallionellaceae bacterium]